MSSIVRARSKPEMSPYFLDSSPSSNRISLSGCGWGRPSASNTWAVRLFCFTLIHMSIAATPKKRGRPATGRDPLICVRIPPEAVATIDAWAAARGVSRSEAIRAMISEALDGPERESSAC